MKNFSPGKWSLTTKLIVSFILVALIPLVAVSIINIRSTQTALENGVGNALEQEAQQVSALLAEILTEQVTIIKTIALNDAVTETVNQRNANYAGDNATILAELQSLNQQWVSAPPGAAASENQELLDRVLSSDPAVNSVSGLLRRYQNAFPATVETFVTDAYGGTLAATEYLPSYYQAENAWWQAAYNGGLGAVYISAPTFDERFNTNVLQLAAPIYAPSGQNVIGIVHTTVTLDALVGEIAAVGNGGTNAAMLLDNQGAVIANPGASGQISLPSDTIAGLFTFPADTSSTHDTAMDENNETTLFASAKLAFLGGSRNDDPLLEAALDRLGWVVVLRQKISVASTPAAGIRNAAIVAVGAIFLVLVVTYLLLNPLLDQLKEIRTTIHAITLGDFNARTQIVSRGELGRIAASLNSMLYNILDNRAVQIQTAPVPDITQDSIRRLLAEVQDVAQGDLTIEARESNDAVGAIAGSFNHMIQQLRDIITGVNAATLQVSTSANQIQISAERLAHGSEEQSIQIVDTSAALDEMSISIQQVSENATQSASVGEQASSNAQRGAKAVHETIEGMNRIHAQVNESALHIQQLGETTKQINEFVKLIRGIADRTSILALNASIQAARAGSSGSGFAVVAQEVERLAERSTTATQQIVALTRTIQDEIDVATDAMEATKQEVVQGVGLVNEAGLTLKEIETVSDQLSQLVQSISLASKQQARGSETIARAMNDIAEVTQQTATGTKETAVSINNLANLADNLRGSVSTFKLPATNGAR